MRLTGNAKVVPYSLESFERQTTHLQKELFYVGVDISYDDAARISFLGRRKYDRYDHFYPGETFDGRLVKWLAENFSKDERQVAIEIVKTLKFVSTYEMKELATRTFENARYTILKDTMHASTNDWYSHVESRNVRMTEELAKSIFVAAADDINFDFFRRYAMRHYSFKKENFVEYYKRDIDSLEELPEHKRIFLLDQLSASGTTALRKQHGEWRGKIPTFERIWGDYIKNDTVYYCPYILSSVSEKNLNERLSSHLEDNSSPRIVISPTCRIPISSCLANEEGTAIDESKPVAKLCKKYYSRFREDQHIEVGGSAYYGYGGAGLTLVFQSNCPNDTICILWHDYNGWYPLFPRVSHHTSGA